MVTPRTASTINKRWTGAASRRLLHIAGGSETIEVAVKTVIAQLLEGVNYPPTDLNQLAKRLGVIAVTKEDIPGTGQLRDTGNGFEIVCAARSSKARDRFTTAHEIAHIVFENSGPHPPRTGRELERLCDMMAAELLMPTLIFQEKYFRDPTICGLFQLASIFKTSLAATAIRCYEFGKKPVFEIYDGRITWNCGLTSEMRYAVDEALKDPNSGNKELREAIRDAINGRVVDTPVLIYSSKSQYSLPLERRLEGYPIGSGARAIFMLSGIQATT